MKNFFRKKDIHNIPINEGLHKNLGVWDLTGFGIAAVIGAGIFSTIGVACYEGGPAVIFLFIFTAIASGLSAMCYAEFSSRVPLSGSAYTYAYYTFGELIAWIIGWALIMEYCIGNIAVAISWSEYFVTLLKNAGIHFPAYLAIDYGSARDAYLNKSNDFAASAYLNAPLFLSVPIIFNLPALLINALVTWIVYRGIKESKHTSNFLVIFKVLVILLVIVVGGYFIELKNWENFMPNKISGVLKGISAVFFAYIGFDAISTTAEECKNPKRDLPRAMFWALLICTILYIALALVLTGVVPYYMLNQKDPLAYIFEHLKMPWLSGIVAISALVAMTSVLLVFQMGQPRIWLSMSRDGLMPKRFSKIHSKYKTPSFATIITGLVVGIPILFFDYQTVIDFCSISTLFAFLVVCAGAIILTESDKKHLQIDDLSNKFKMPLIASRKFLPLLLLLFLGISMYFQFDLMPHTTQGNISEDKNTEISILGFVINYSEEIYFSWTKSIFLVSAFLFSLWAIYRDYSLIPVLGVISCMYLLSGMTLLNWIYFLIWMVLGLIIYLSYSRHRSILGTRDNISTH
ncbi:MAG: amino acid permease [Chitinophagales bacterium]|jgi:amino acid transporter|nr:amino acid permease [Chitinophagales bacterium]